jgi:hypothetical protein
MRIKMVNIMKMLDEIKAAMKWLMKVPGVLSNMLQCLPKDFRAFRLRVLYSWPADLLE